MMIHKKKEAKQNCKHFANKAALIVYKLNNLLITIKFFILRYKRVFVYIIYLIIYGCILLFDFEE